MVPLGSAPLTSGVAAPERGRQIRESRGQPQDTARVRARARARARVCARKERYPAKYRVASPRPLIQRGRAWWASIGERHRVSAEQRTNSAVVSESAFGVWENATFSDRNHPLVARSRGTGRLTLLFTLISLTHASRLATRRRVRHLSSPVSYTHLTLPTTD